MLARMVTLALRLHEPVRVRADQRCDCTQQQSSTNQRRRLIRLVDRVADESDTANNTEGRGRHGGNEQQTRDELTAATFARHDVPLARR